MNKRVLLMGIFLVAVAGYSVFIMGDDYNSLAVEEKVVMKPTIKKGTKDPEPTAPIFGQLATAAEEAKEDLEKVAEEQMENHVK